MLPWVFRFPEGRRIYHYTIKDGVRCCIISGGHRRGFTQKSLLHLRHSKTVSVCVFSWGELVIFSAQFCNTWLYVPRARAHCSSSMITAHCHALSWFYIIMREALSQAGVDTFLFSGDSFSIGAASTAAQADLNDSW